MNSETTGLKVGEVARRAGLTVRTLHHYHRIGLLEPSGRTDSGYRLYSREDIARLQQILSLTRLGFSLLETARCLASGELSPPKVLEMHLSRLEGQIAAQQRLKHKLERLASRLGETRRVTVEELLDAIKEITNMDKYYTAEQLEELKLRAETLGSARIKEVEAEWPRLIAQVREELDKGTEPGDERVQALAKRWRALVEEFTGGNPAIEDSLRRRYADDPTAGRPDMDPRMREYAGYIEKALEAGKRT